MSTQTQDHADIVDRLRTLAILSVMFGNNDRAKLIWNRHHARDLGQMPRVVVSASNGMFDLEGLVIHGRRDGGMPWDYDGTLTILTEDNEIIDLHGWMATDMDVSFSEPE
jgi:hypothetical protein